MPAPDLVTLALAVLRSAVAAEVYSQQLSARESSPPYIVIRALPGGREVDPRFPSASGPVQIDAYAAARDAAQDLAVSARDALVQAWQQHTTTPEGSLTNVTTISPPAASTGIVPDGLHRSTATYSLTAVA